MLRTLALTAAFAVFAFPALADKEFGKSFQEHAPAALGGEQTALQDIEPAAGEEAQAPAGEEAAAVPAAEGADSVEPAAGADQSAEEPEAAADEAAAAGEEAAEGETANEAAAEAGEATEY